MQKPLHSIINWFSYQKVVLPLHLLIFLQLFIPSNSEAYSLLTHEAIIDVSWKKTFEPLLLTKYPGASAEQLQEAHAYAYGGAIMPDIGYSPFGSKIYTNLVHNVRTGDYVDALIAKAQNINEFAFALGALAHYNADSYGHSIGTNLAVPLDYPKVKRKFGQVVTYADHKSSHSCMEFGFDVLQTARGNYSNKDYHDFIGFKTSESLLEKAFFEVYGLELKSVFKNYDLAISTYRWTIKTLLPNMVRTAWAKKKSEIKKIAPTATARTFHYRIKRRTYYQDFNDNGQKIGFVNSALSFIIPIFPKLGPLGKFRFKVPSEAANKAFIQSFDTTLTHFENELRLLANHPNIRLKNKILDTGQEARKGLYVLTDECYEDYVLMLYKSKSKNINPAIRQDVNMFFGSVQDKKQTGKNKKSTDVSVALVSLNNK